MKVGLMRFMAVCFVSALMLPGGVAVGNDDGSSVQERVAQVEAYYDRAGFFGFQGVVLIAQGDEVLFARGYGYADSEAQRRNDPDTLFDVGSIAKPIVAAAVLKLESDGKLSLDDPVREYIPFEAPEDDDWGRENLTIRQLLAHRSGLSSTNLSRPEFEDIDLNNDPEALFGRYFEVANRIYPPDYGTRYNNLAYCALAYIVQKTSGMPFEEYCVKHLLLPAGMDESGFAWQEHLNPQLAAMGYESGEEKFRAGALPYGWGFRGATGLVTSANDLHRWAIAVRDGTVLPPEANDAYLSPGEPTTEPGRLIGMAWETEVDGFTTARVRHGGLTHGFVSSFAMDLQEDTTIVVLCNETEMRPLVRKAEKIMQGEGVEMPPDVADDIDPSELEAAVGRWTFPGGDILEMEVDGDALRGLAKGITTAERFIGWRQSGHTDTELFRSHLSKIEEYVSTLVTEGPEALMPDPDADLSEGARERIQDRLLRFGEVISEVERERGEIRKIEAVCLRWAHRESTVMVHLECEHGTAALEVKLNTYPGEVVRSLTRIPTAFVATGRLYPEGDGVFAMYRKNLPDLRIRLGEELGEPILTIEGDGGHWSRDIVGWQE